MKKIYLLFFAIITNICMASANPFKNDLNASSYYIQSLKSDNVIEKNNEKTLYDTSSVENFTKFLAGYYTLGDDFEFKTSIYEDDKNNLYIKLSGDPLLSGKNLVELFKDLKTKYDTSKINNIYIDDFIFINDSTEDITPYIADFNKTKFAINRSSLSTKIDIIQNDDYKVPVINELKIGEKQEYLINIQNIRYSPMWVFKGTVSKDEVVELPVLKPEINFKTKVYKALEKNEIKYLKAINVQKTPKNAKYLTSFSHSIKEVSKNFLYNENELCVKSIFYTAAAKYTDYSETASKKDVYNMLERVLSSIIKENDYVINKEDNTIIINAEALCELTKYMLNNTKLIEILPRQQEGNLKGRFYFLKDNLRAFSSFNSTDSTTLGIMKTKKNEEIVFSLISQINNEKNKAKLKIIENELITRLYRKF